MLLKALGQQAALTSQRSELPAQGARQQELPGKQAVLPAQEAQQPALPA